MASQTYLTALRSSTRKPIFKIEWMNKDEVVVDEVITDLLDGNISTELKNGVRRSCNLQLENNDGKYLPNPDGLVYIEKKFKLYTGLRISGIDYFNPQGVFNLGNPVARRDFSKKTVSIEGYDNFALLNGTLAGTLETDYIIDVGESITDAVKQIFEDAGIVKEPVIESSSEILPYTLIASAGDTYFKLLDEMANILSWVVYFDVDGRPRFESAVDETTEGEVWEFRVDEATLLPSDHNYDFMKVRNYIIVHGENLNGNLVTGTAQDDGLFSSTSVDRIGKRTEVIEDDNIYSTELAQDRAEYELKERIQLYENIDMKCIPVDIIKEGNVILIDDPGNGVNRERYLVKNIDYPLSFNSLQTMKVWKTRTISGIGVIG